MSQDPNPTPEQPTDTLLPGSVTVNQTTATAGGVDSQSVNPNATPGGVTVDTTQADNSPTATPDTPSGATSSPMGTPVNTPSLEDRVKHVEEFLCYLGGFSKLEGTP